MTIHRILYICRDIARELISEALANPEQPTSLEEGRMKVIKIKSDMHQFVAIILLSIKLTYIM